MCILSFAGSGHDKFKLYQEMLRLQDAALSQDGLEESQDAPDYYQDVLGDQDASSPQDAASPQDASSYDEDTTTKWQQQVAKTIQDSKARIFVGVVTDDAHLSRTAKVTMDTWGQSSTNLTFYSLGGVEDEKEEEKWAWPDPLAVMKGKRRSYQRGGVVRLKYSNERGVASTVPDTPPGAGEAMQVLHHMQVNLMDLFDWFLLVPENVYVQLDTLGSRLSKLDPDISLIFGLPKTADSADDDVGSASGCAPERGVVLSRRYLWDLTGEMESVVDSSACGGQSPWQCLYRQVVGKAGLDCIHDNQVRKKRQTQYSL